jgi:hypothetical protein
MCIVDDERNNSGHSPLGITSTAHRSALVLRDIVPLHSRYAVRPGKTLLASVSSASKEMENFRLEVRILDAFFVRIPVPLSLNAV